MLCFSLVKKERKKHTYTHAHTCTHARARTHARTHANPFSLLVCMDPHTDTCSEHRPVYINKLSSYLLAVHFCRAGLLIK